MAPQDANTNNNESSTIEPNDTNTSGADDSTPPVDDDDGGGVTQKKKITAANASKSFRSGLIANEDIMEDAGQVRVDEAQLWGRGIVADFRRTIYTHWLSEMTNFNQKTVAVSVLLFIAVITPTLTFGAVYGKTTNNQIGTVETILATSWVGCLFAIFSGMPLVRTSSVV
jgi:HCO3- transporter family